MRRAAADREGIVPMVPPQNSLPVRRAHLIGICGTGMGSLAGLLADAGVEVRGSDESVYPPMSTMLRDKGIRVLEGYRAAHLDDRPDLVIVGNIATRKNPEAVAAVERGTGSNQAKASRPARKPPICACQAMACSSPDTRNGFNANNALMPNHTSKKASTRGSRNATESGTAGTR